MNVIFLLFAPVREIETVVLVTETTFQFGANPQKSLKKMPRVVLSVWRDSYNFLFFLLLLSQKYKTNSSQILYQLIMMDIQAVEFTDAVDQVFQQYINFLLEFSQVEVLTNFQ